MSPGDVSKMVAGSGGEGRDKDDYARAAGMRPYTCPTDGPGAAGAAVAAGAPVAAGSAGEEGAAEAAGAVGAAEAAGTSQAAGSSGTLAISEEIPLAQNDDLSWATLRAGVRALRRDVRLLSVENELLLRALLRGACAEAGDDSEDIDEGQLREQLQRAGERAAEQLERAERVGLSSAPTSRRPSFVAEAVAGSAAVVGAAARALESALSGSSHRLQVPRESQTLLVPLASSSSLSRSPSLSRSRSPSPTPSGRRASSAGGSGTLSLAAFERMGLRLSAAAKAELAQRHVDEGQRALRAAEAAARRRAALERARAEAAAATAAELRDARAGLERVRPPVRAASSARPRPRAPAPGRAEPFFRRLADFQRAADQRVRSLQLRVAALRRRLNGGAAGDAPSAVDLEKLRIDAASGRRALRQRERRVAEVKRVAEDCERQQRAQRRAAQERRAAEAQLQRAQEGRAQRRAASDAQTRAAQADVQGLALRVATLRHLRQCYTAPPALDYARKYAEVADLRQQLKTWLRRTTVQSAVLRGARRRPLPAPPAPGAAHPR